jgi:hypothetical protein
MIDIKKKKRGAAGIGAYPSRAGGPPSQRRSEPRGVR